MPNKSPAVLLVGIFAAAVVLSANGLHHAAVTLGRIPSELAWLFLGCLDLLAVVAFHTWRQAVDAGQTHWAGYVAAGAVVVTVALNSLSAFPELAPAWIGPAIAALPPIAALLAAALRMESERLARTAVRDTSTPVPTPGLPVDTVDSVVPALLDGQAQPPALAAPPQDPSPGGDRSAEEVPTREGQAVPAQSGAARARTELDRLLDTGMSLGDRTLARSVAEGTGVSLRTARRVVTQRRNTTAGGGS